MGNPLVICGFPAKKGQVPWWRPQMETFFALLALCERNPPVTGEFPSQRPLTRSFDVFFDVRLNKWLNKQSRRRWFETPSRHSQMHLKVGGDSWYLPIATLLLVLIVRFSLKWFVSSGQNDDKQQRVFFITFDIETYWKYIDIERTTQTCVPQPAHSTLNWPLFNRWNIDFHVLTHWDQVTHLCTSKLTTIGSDNGLSAPSIIWTNHGILFIRTLGANFNEIFNEIHTFSFKKMHVNMSSGKMAAILSRPQCVDMENRENFCDKGQDGKWSGAGQKSCVMDERFFLKLWNTQIF